MIFPEGKVRKTGKSETISENEREMKTKCCRCDTIKLLIQLNIKTINTNNLKVDTLRLVTIQ